MATQTSQRISDAAGINAIKAAIRKSDASRFNEFSSIFTKHLYYQDEKGNTLLHYCAKKNRYEWAREILKFEHKHFEKLQKLYRKKSKGLNSNYRSNAYNCSKMQTGILESNAKVLSYRHGALTNQTSINMEPVLSGAQSVVHDNAVEVFEATTKSHKLTEIPNYDGLLPIHFAGAFYAKYEAEDENRSVLGLLIDKNFNTIHYRDPFYGLTPLHYTLLKSGDHSDTATSIFLNKINSYKKFPNQLKKMEHLYWLVTDPDVALQNSLHYAATYGCDGALERLLNQLGLCKEYTDNASEDLLANSRLNAVKPYLFIEDNDSNIPLHLACYEGKINCIQKLLEHEEHQTAKSLRMEIDEKLKSYNETCQYPGDDPWNKCLDMEEMLKDEEEDIGKQISYVYDNCKQLTHKDKTNFYPLHLVLNSGSDSSLSYILMMYKKQNKISRVINAPTSEGGMRPVLMAAKNKLGFVKILRDFGADLNSKNDSGDTTLIVAAEENEPAIIEYLLEKITNDEGEEVVNCDEIDINETNNHENTALHIAAKQGNIDCFDMLLNYSFNGWFKRKSNYDDQDSTRQLNLLCENESEKSVLHVLAENIEEDKDYGDDYLKMTKMVFTNCDDRIFMNKRDSYAITRMKDSDGNTALHIACARGQVKLAEYFIKETSFGNTLDAKNEYDETPMMLAAKNNQRKLVRLLASINEDTAQDEDQDANTPLHLAAREGHTEVVQELLDASAEIGCKNCKDETPLDFAAKYGQTDVCRLLLDNDADIDPVDKAMNKTPLMLASENGHHETVLFLLENGAKPYITTKVTKLWRKIDPSDAESPKICYEEGGLNCLELAIVNGHQECAKAILLSDYWEECLRNANFDREGNVITPFRRLIKKYPLLASIVLNKCVEIKNSTCRLNFEFIEDLFLVEYWHDMRGLDTEASSGGERTSFLNSQKESEAQTQPQLELPVGGYSEMDPFPIDRPMTENSSSHSQDYFDVYGGSNGNGTQYDEKGLLRPGAEYYHYQQILKRPNENDTDTQSKTPDALQMKSNHVLTYIKQSNDITLLKHPLVLKLLDTKWKAYGKFFYFFDLFLYAFFVILLHVYVAFFNPNQLFFNRESGNFEYTEHWYDNITYQEYRLAGGSQAVVKCPKFNEYIESSEITQFESYRNYHNAHCDPTSIARKLGLTVTALLLVTLLLRVIMEARSLISRGIKLYINDPMNWVEFILYACTAYYLWPWWNPFYLNSEYSESHREYLITYTIKTEWQQICGAIAILLSWANLLLFIRQFSKLGLYVLMFENVLTTFLEFGIVLVVFISGFAFTFNMLLGNKIPFQNISTGFISVLVMMIGELEYQTVLLGHLKEEVGDDKSFTANMYLENNVINIIYIIFLVTMTIVVMNLMTGLAVDDIEKIRSTSEGRKLGMLISNSLSLEFKLPAGYKDSCILRLPIIKNIIDWRCQGSRMYLEFDIDKALKNYKKKGMLSKVFADEKSIDPEEFKEASRNHLWQPTTEEDVDDLDETMNENMKKEKEMENVRKDVGNIKEKLGNLDNINERIGNLENKLNLLLEKLNVPADPEDE